MSNLTDALALAVEWLNIIFGILIFIFGILGNCLNIFVFTRPAYRNSTVVLYLLAYSVASCVQLVNTLLPRVLSDGFQVPIVQSSNGYCQSRTLIAAVASLGAISYPCWASFDQFISTSRNAAIRLRWSSKRFASQAILFTMLFWLIIYIPSTVFSRALGNSCTSNNRMAGVIYSYSAVPLGYCILPIILLTYFNIGIIKNLRDTPVVVVSNTSKRMARQVLRMLIPQLIILIISGLPYVTQTLYSTATASTAKSGDQVAIENLIGHITRLLFYLNYISLFYIYLLTSSEFRKILRQLFVKQDLVSRHGTVVVIPNI